MNQVLITTFLELAGYMQLEGDKYRAIAFQRVADNLIAHKSPILIMEDVPHLPGMGKSTFEIIEEVFELGYSSRLQDLQRKHYKSYKILEEFKSCYGIGSAKALELYQAGARSIQDLQSGRYDELLPPRSQIALKYAEDLRHKIPRWEMQVYDMLFQELFARLGLKYLLAGSYRRGVPESGDLDVLIQKPESGSDLKLLDIIDYLQPIILERLVLGNTLFNGIARLEKSDLARRIDIRYIPEQSWACASIYFTGDRDFNILLRRRAQALGYQLNEYGLKTLEAGTVGKEEMANVQLNEYGLKTLEAGTVGKEEMANVQLNTEEEVFRKLGLPYIPPRERNKHALGGMLMREHV